MSRSILVGAHFRPPASLLLAELPSGFPLELRPEPENPYDPMAVAIWITIDPRYLPPDDALISVGWTQLDLLSKTEIQLGYLARQGNKVLSRHPGLISASEALALLPCEAVLQWGPNGEPFILLASPQPLAAQ